MRRGEALDPGLRARAGYLKLPNGRALTGQSHDYRRDGTTTLFAALEVATGKIIAAHSNASPRRVSRLHEKRPRGLSGPKAEERSLAQGPPQCAISFHASSAARCLAFIKRRRAKEARRSIATNCRSRDTPSYPRHAPNGDWQWISVRPFGTLFELMLLEINEGTSRRVMNHAKKRYYERPKFDETSKCPRNRQG